MSIGKSGRVVVEIDPELKKKLYADLTSQGLSLKEWFIDSACKHLKIEPEHYLETNSEDGTPHVRS